MGTLRGGSIWKAAVTKGERVNYLMKEGEVFYRDSKIYAGNTTEYPTDKSQITNLIKLDVFSENITFNLNGTDNFVVVAIPQSQELNKIISSNNETLFDRNKPEDNNFILDNNLSVIPDIDGEQISYNVYILETVLPFSSNMFLKIILL